MVEEVVVVVVMEEEEEVVEEVVVVMVVEGEVVVEMEREEEEVEEDGGWVKTKVFIHSLSGLALRRVWEELRDQSYNLKTCAIYIIIYYIYITHLPCISCVMQYFEY